MCSKDLENIAPSVASKETEEVIRIMKQLVCEMCGGTDLIKDGGVFVCQSCGCKYSVEEAKKMMIEGTVEVTGTVKVDNTGAIDNYLKMAASAIAGKNGESANNYADKALELDPANATAWYIKMQAAAVNATPSDCKVSEQGVAGRNAIRFTKGDIVEVEKMELAVYSHLLDRAKLYYQIAANANHDQIKQAYNAAIRVNGWTASDRVANADSSNISSMQKLVGEGGNISDYVPDEAYGKYPELQQAAYSCASAFRSYKNAMIDRIKIYGRKYNDGGASFDRIINIYETKAKNGKKKYDEERAVELQRRRDVYWQEHAEDKDALEKELEELATEKAELEGKVKECEQERRKITDTISIDYSERNSLNDRIKEFEKQQQSLGLFKGKEKKQLQVQIDTLKSEVKTIEAQLGKRKQEMEEAIAPSLRDNKERRDRYQNRINDISKRTKEIQQEFKKDR